MERSTGRNSPVFNWSPLPQKRYFNKSNIKCETEENLYPKCDSHIWLRSCEQEILEPLHGKITGYIPEWLNGTLIRNGPGCLNVGDRTFEHIFDSASLLHRFSIHNGNVTYQCRFLQSDEYKKNMEAKKIVVTTFGTKAVPDPCQTIFQRVSSIFSPRKNQSDNAMISVYPFCDELYAFTETPIIHKINIETLETEKKVDVSDHIAIVNHTSHPHILSNGTVYNLAMTFGKTGPTHKIICFPSNNENDANNSMFNEARFEASLHARWPLNPSYMHTFGITENYFVIVEQPLSLSVVNLVKCKYYNDPLIGSLKWYHNEKVKINLLCRTSGKLLHHFLSDTFFYLHIINQYEIGNYIVLDICCYRDPSMLECMYVEAIKNIHNNPDYAKMFRGRPLRFVLPIRVDTNKINENLIDLPDTKAKAYIQSNGEIFVQPERICNMGCETPRINYQLFLGKEYRFFYAISSDVDIDHPGSIIKVDVKYKTTLTWYEDNCFPSEPIFVPAPNSKDEDDGIVLSAMVWGGDDVNHVGMMILDARTFKEIGRVEFKTPSPVPKCLHGWFVPKQ